MIKSDLNLSAWSQGLAELGSPELRESLARSMAVAGGQVLRDEAKAYCPRDTGLLASSIYLAYKDGRSNEQQVIYSVSWNSRIAPHGHLIEFGHWQPYKVVKLPNGDWFTTKERLPTPKFTAAKPFLRPAFDSGRERAKAAMIQRGMKRLPELLAGESDEP